MTPTEMVKYGRALILRRPDLSNAQVVINSKGIAVLEDPIKRAPYFTFEELDRVHQTQTLGDEPV